MNAARFVTPRAILGYVLLWTAGYALWGERILLHGGLGWDGEVYAFITQNPLGLLQKGQLSAYQIHRLVPPVVVHAMLWGARIPQTPAAIIAGYQIFNGLLLALAGYYWLGILRTITAGDIAKSIATTLLFITYPVLKQLGYYPIVMDTAAFTLGMAGLYYYRRNRVMGQCVTMLIGGFVWPSIMPLHTLLLLFPPGVPLFLSAAQVPEESRTAVFRRWATRLAALGVLGILLGQSILVYFWGRYLHEIRVNAVSLSIRSLEWVSVGCVAIYFILAVRPWIRAIAGISWGFLHHLTWQRRAMAAAIVWSLYLSLGFRLGQWANPAYDQPYMVAFGLLATSLLKPGIFLVAHGAYFGLIAVLVVVAYRRFVHRMHELGGGITLLFFATVIQAIDSESRHLLSLMPLWAFGLLSVIQDLRPRLRDFWATLLLCMLFSACWFTLNAPGAETGGADPVLYPLQRYFMRYGPWMSTLSYIGYGILLVVVGGFVYKRTQKMGSANSKG